ncbi:MAG: polymerase delta subunit [Gemmatimonadetes bacterium]|nr:polymerase delta subunit [Gemmatimonadota bacterium]
MPLLPLYGHTALLDRFRDALSRQSLPGSLLLQGPRGIGKQQVALWLGRSLLCENPDRSPCGECKSCRMSSALQHPDLHWFFPRPRLKDSDPDLAAVRGDNVDGIMERLESSGVYEAPGGDEGIFVATVRAIVQTAIMSPAMGRRKVFVVGDADRMVAQEGADQAANAFLKLLEEPPADTTIILTSSESGALLPTIRSRVVSVRVAPLSEQEVRAFLADPVVSAHLDVGPRTVDELVALASGAPGRLIGRDSWQAALTQARRLLDAAAAPDRGTRLRVALGQGASGARGKFSDTLDALTVLLHERSRSAAAKGFDSEAVGSARAIEFVERAKELASGNVNPQLVTASLLRELAPLVK